MFFTAVPATELKSPPMYAFEQPGPLKAIELTMPLIFGCHDVILYGAVALKLKTPVRRNLVPCWTIDLKLPAA